MEIIQNLFGSNLKTAFFIIINLILIESLLSVDNAAVLATMVMDLPPELRGTALKYGILGAYVFRGLCLVFASFLIKVLWLKALGGLYLLWLFFKFFKDIFKYGEKGYFILKILSIALFIFLDHSYTSVKVFTLSIDVVFIVKALLGIYAAVLLWELIQFFQRSSNTETEAEVNKLHNPVYLFTSKFIGPFWSTVVLVELMDLAFSLDNVFAAVAFTDKIGLICLGVFIGILAMRYAAQAFVSLLEKFPFLEAIAFLVIGVLGLKLTGSYACDVSFPSTSAAISAGHLQAHEFGLKGFCQFLNGHNGDLATSVLTIALFFLPIITSIAFNFPRKHELKE